MMKRTSLLLATALLLLPTATLAQEKADNAPLPAICTAGTMAGMDMGGAKAAPAAGSAATPMDDAHQALMAGMDKMDAGMAAGMQAADIDVAFVCGMIPHHQGAIAMARAELKYGKDPANRKLAEGIIKAQEQEVTEMLAWLAKRVK